MKSYLFSDRYCITNADNDTGGLQIYSHV